jgi:hypothetical protein
MRSAFLEKKAFRYISILDINFSSTFNGLNLLAVCEERILISHAHACPYIYLYFASHQTAHVHAGT